MSNEQTPWGRKDIPVGTKVITSGDISARWANRILVVEKQPAGRNGVNYVLRDSQTREGVRVNAGAVRVYTGDREYGHEAPSVTAIEFVPSIPAGVVARAHGLDRWGIPDGTLVVSEGPSGGRRINQTKVVLLGGDPQRPGSYWPGVPTKNLTVVDVLALIAAGEAATAAA
ncbi:hypothetical protein [Cellulosimicrobium sp. Marseille-Q4280]|uniref:hypothetical protein n=1 Tax=Cellulosimicrobium sp. Marseille-Q4280 TaxID=2937992 RepID=UPI002041198E|nr:hypothetical protein [Cellulosimicrobium sp. Marseille-Q4280]